MKTKVVATAFLLFGFAFKVYSQNITFSTTVDVDSGSDVGWSVIVLDDGYLVGGGMGRIIQWMDCP